MYEYKIIDINRVIDGDTFVCIIDMGFYTYKKIIVRLLNFDAIETRKTKKFYEQSSTYKVSPDKLDKIADMVRNKLLELLMLWKERLVLESKELDSFGRALGITRIIDEGITINEMIYEYQKKLLNESTT